MIIRNDPDYKLIEHPSKHDISLLYTRFPYLDGEFCCGTAEQDEAGQWAVWVAAPFHSEVHEIRLVKVCTTKSEAIKTLWEQRLWMHWDYHH
jgi:hypothetical protein